VIGGDLGVGRSELPHHAQNNITPGGKFAMSRLVAFLGALWLSVGAVDHAWAACKPSGARETFSLLCRGKLTLINEWDDGELSTTHGVFFKNPRPAGKLGEQLRPSSCAWADRPLNDNEPNRFRFGTNRGIRGTQVFGHILIQCAGDRDCVFIVCALNDPSRPGALSVLNNFINSVYPEFR